MFAPVRSATTIAMFTDGTSSTIAYTEALVGNYGDLRMRMRNMASGVPGTVPPAADLRDARRPAQEAIAAQVLDSRLPASSKLALAEGLGDQLAAEGGRVPDLSPAFRGARLPAAQATRAARLEAGLDDQLERAATGAFRDAFLLAGLLALLAVVPALMLRRGDA